MRATHLSGQMQCGLSPNPYNKQKERTNRFLIRNVLSFFVRRYVCKQTRYTRFARAIYCRFAPMRYDINSLTPRRAYRLPKANIALEGKIANHARDLYRCVFSVKDNTLNLSFLFCFHKRFVLILLTRATYIKVCFLTS